MDYGKCNLSIVPGRSEPSDRAELVTQILFGEDFEIVDENKRWYHIKLIADSYDCWVDKMQVVLMERSANEGASAFVSGIDGEAVDMKGSKTRIPFGSVLPSYEEGSFLIDDVEYTFTGDVILSGEASTDNLQVLADRLLNTPYLWGGRTSYGIDCSGYTQTIFRLAGVALPRDSGDQAIFGEEIEHVEESRNSDLAFFENEKSKIMHVGIIRLDEDNNRHIIHASGKVRVDSLDEKGIYDKETGTYTHRISHISRYF
ncbi:MAG: hydrolase Nlp/P60 [Bacteroidetes bacterium]|nr:MAG: hydrolase Nlp/P60 [Bacteroidota bacterium]